MLSPYSLSLERAALALSSQRTLRQILFFSLAFRRAEHGFPLSLSLSLERASLALSSQRTLRQILFFSLAFRRAEHGFPLSLSLELASLALDSQRTPRQISIDRSRELSTLNLSSSLGQIIVASRVRSSVYLIL